MEEQELKSQKKNQKGSTLKQATLTSTANSLKTFNMKLPGPLTTGSRTRSSRQYCRSPLETAFGRMSTMCTINESKFEFKQRRGSRQVKREKEKLVEHRKDQQSSNEGAKSSRAANTADNSHSKGTISTTQTSKLKYPNKSNFSSGNKIVSNINTLVVAGDKGGKTSHLKS